MGRQQPPDLRQQRGGNRDDGLIALAGSGGFVGRNPLVVGPCIQVGEQFLDALLIPAGRELLVFHRFRLLCRRRVPKSASTCSSSSGEVFMENQAEEYTPVRRMRLQTRLLHCLRFCNSSRISTSSFRIS
jgi:hypothetical protein